MKSLRPKLEEANNQYIQNGPVIDVAMETARRMQLASGQAPKTMVLSCADSRVPVERILNGGVGDYFVVRTAGNVAETSQIASLEFGAAVLGAQTLLVLGHTGCGAVSAAVNYVCEHQKLPSKALNSLAEMIAPAVIRVSENSDLDQEQTVKAATVENIKHQIQVLREESEILRKREEQGQLEFLGGVYNIGTGEIQFIDL